METYKLTTIKDIFDKVPTDRVEHCMKEITSLIIQAKATKDLLGSVADFVTGRAR